MARRARTESGGASLDDGALVARACAGDHAPFGELFRRHAPDLLRFVERRSGSAALADDVVAVTFEKAWRQVCDIEARRIEFRPWLFRLAGNELIDQQRSTARRRRRESAVSSGDARLTESDTPLGSATEDDDLRAALSTLSGTHQQVIALRWFADLTPKEVAAALGVSTGTAAVRTHRALAALRRAIVEASPDDRAPHETEADA